MAHRPPPGRNVVKWSDPAAVDPGIELTDDIREMLGMEPEAQPRAA